MTQLYDCKTKMTVVEEMNSPLVFRKLTFDDESAAAVLLAGCAAIRKIDNWYAELNEYPACEVHADIGSGAALGLFDGDELVAYAAMVSDVDPDYVKVAGFEPEPRSLSLHRLGVKLSRQGNGIARLMLAELKSYARNRDANVIYLDIYQPCAHLARMYGRAGFTEVGAFWRDGEARAPFVLYCIGLN